MSLRALLEKIADINAHTHGLANMGDHDKAHARLHKNADEIERLLREVFDVLDYEPRGPDVPTAACWKCHQIYDRNHLHDDGFGGLVCHKCDLGQADGP